MAKGPQEPKRAQLLLQCPRDRKDMQRAIDSPKTRLPMYGRSTGSIQIAMYVQIGQGSSDSQLSWGLYKETAGDEWFLAFDITKSADKCYGITELIESKKVDQSTLCVLPFLPVTVPGAPNAHNLPANRLELRDPYKIKNLGIEIYKASLSLNGAVLNLQLHLQLDIPKSLKIELGSIQATSEATLDAKIRFQNTWNDESYQIELPKEEIKLPFTSQDLGFLFRLRNKSGSANEPITINLKEKAITIPKFALQMGLICPLSKDRNSNKLQLSSPEDRELSLICSSDLRLNRDGISEFRLIAESNNTMHFPGLYPNLGALSEQTMKLKMGLIEDWLINKQTLSGRGQISLEVNQNTYNFLVDLKFDLEAGCLRESEVVCTLQPPILIDLGFLAIEILPPKESELPKGYFDLASGDFWIKPDGGSVRAYIPGNFKSNSTTAQEQQQRFLFDLVPPKDPLDPGKPGAILLLGARGISLFAKQNAKVVDLNSGVNKLEPLEQSGGISSILEIRRNRIVKATFFARTELPGFSDQTPIKVLAEIGLRQKDPSKLPELIAGLQLEKADAKPLATLDLGPIDSQVDELRMKLTWDEGWTMEAEIDGKLWLNDSAKMPDLVGGLSKEKPACFEGLKLKEQLEPLILRLSEAPRFELMDGKFALSSESLSFEKTDGSTLQIICDKANFNFKGDSPIEVDIQPGGLKLIFTIDNNDTPPKFLLCPVSGRPISLTARLGPSVKLSGQIQWIDNSGSQLVDAPAEKGIGVAGMMEITGLPPIRAAAYFGVGKKNSGESVLSVFLYAETDVDVQLYPGVYLKSVGAGMGINRGLAAIGLNPRPEKILSQLDSLQPGDLNAWKFIPEQQFYLSLMASILVGSVAGDQSRVSPFLLWMLVAVDSQGKFAAAAKLWLSSSPKFIREGDNFSRPAAEAALVILPQQRLLSLRVITKHNPAIEKDAGIKNILDRSQVQFSYFMSPSFLDFYLEQATFSTKWVGLNWHVSGTFRTAIVSFGAMTKADVMASATLKRELGGSSAGASFKADLVLRLEMAGLVSGGETYSYALVSASMAAKAKLWLRIILKAFGQRFSKDFSTSKRVNAALAGTMGLDSSGAAGIAGSIDIETSICGHDCSVSGRFNVKEDLVHAVRSKVGLFEKRLEAQKVAVARALRLWDKQPPQWILHCCKKSPNEVLLLLLPSSHNRDWLGVLNSEGDIKVFKQWLAKIEIFLPEGDQSEHIGVWHQEDQQEGDIKELDSPYIGSCQELQPELMSDEDEMDWLKGFLLQDQRVREESRNYWREEDQERLAAGVLPLEFRDLEDVEASGQADACFEEVLLYQYLHQRANRVSRHSLRQINTHNAKVRSLRGLVSQEAIRVLMSAQNGELPKHLPFIRINSPHANTSSFKALITKKMLQGDEYKEVLEDEDLKVDSLTLDEISLGPPRQRCVIENERPYLEIKLPIIINTKAGQRTEAWKLIGDQLHRIDSFEVYRQLPGEQEPQLLADNLQLSFRKVRTKNPLDQNAPEENFVLLDPYLLTDRIELEWSSQEVNRTAPQLDFLNPALKGARLPEVTYEVKVKPLSGWKASSDGAERMPLPCGGRTATLQILPPPPILVDLVAHLPVKALKKKNPLVDLEIGRMNGEQFKRVDNGDAVFGSSQSNYLEVWLEETKVDGSRGFFGEEMPLRDPSKPGSLEDLKAARPAQSRRRKTQIGRWSKEGLKNHQGDNFNESSCELKEGYAYRIFVGHASDGPWKGLLTELPCALKADNDESGLKFSHTIELIPAQTSALLTMAEFEARRGSTENNILELQVMPFHTELLGGFEVFIRDRDESHLFFRLEREMIDARYFPASQMDARNSALWQLANDTSSSHSSTDTSDPSPTTSYSFYIDEDNRERQKLIDAAGQLYKMLETDADPWPRLYQQSQEFWSCVWAYQRTSTFVNSHDPWDLLKYQFRFLFTGLALPNEADPEKKPLEDLTKRWGQFNEALLEIESTDVAALSDDDFDDFEIAAQMAAICRHRQEIAEELFGNADGEVPVIRGDENSKLPGQTVWPKDSKGRLSKKLESFFPSSGDQLRRNYLKVLSNDNSTFTLKVLDSPEDIKACVAHCTDLSNLLYDLKQHLKRKNWELVKRPHHTVQTTLDGTKRVPVPTKAEYLLPQSQPAPQRAATQGRQASQVEPAEINQLASTTPIYLANFLERLGFAVDVAAYDALGQPVNAKLLEAELREVIKKLSLQGTLVVWLPQENRGPQPKNPVSEPASYGFLKIGVVPNLSQDELNNLAISRGIVPEKNELGTYLIPGITHILRHPNQLVHPIGQRWLTLCSTGGQTISYWDGYDNKRRVFEICVRPMSRYERLLRWAGLDSENSEPFPSEVKSIRTVRHFNKVSASDAELLKPLPVYVHQHSSRIQFSYSLPPEGARALMNNLSAIRTGWNGVEVALRHEELYDGDPYRKFKEYLQTVYSMDRQPPVDTYLRKESLEHPRVMELNDNIDKTQSSLGVDDTLVATLSNDNSRYLLIENELLSITNMVDTKTINVERAQLGTLPSMHEKGIAIQLLAGMDSSLADAYTRGSEVIKLSLSAGATPPDANCFLSVDKEIFWVRAVERVVTSSDSVHSESFNLLVENGQLGTENTDHATGTTAVVLLPAMEASQLRLFRNERLISCAHLPYCLRYSMSCRVHYEYQPGQWIFGEGTNGQSPSSELIATREPARLSRWSIITSSENKKECILVLSRFWDLLTRNEQDQYLALPGLEQESLPSVAYLPDPSLIYDIYYYLPPSIQTSGGGVFLHLDSLLMPLAPGAPDSGKPSLLKKKHKLDITVAGTTPAELQFQVTVPLDVPPGLDEETFDPGQLRLLIRRGAHASTLRHTPDSE